MLPWVINLVPTPDEHGSRLLRPVSFSIRDSDTFIDPTNMRVKAGYAKIFSDAEEKFDELPRTRRIAMATGVAGEPLITISSGELHIEKTSHGLQRSVYTTSIEGGIGFNSAMVTAVLRPDVITPAGTPGSPNPLALSVFPGPLLPLPYSGLSGGSFAADSGTILGIEHGPRNMAIYLRFQQHTDSTKYIRFSSQTDELGSSPVIDSSTLFDWSSLHRYTIVWNEVDGNVEVYAHVGTVTQRLFNVPISSIPELPVDYFAKAGGGADVTAIYGQLGPLGDKSSWTNIAVTCDVGYPIVGTIRPGDFITTVNGAEYVAMDTAKDPREVDISVWSTAEESVLADKDSAATTAAGNGSFKITKATSGKTFALYREEPGLLSSDTDGFMIQATLTALDNELEASATGMGIVVSDGTTVFHLQLLDDLERRTIGLLKKDGNPIDLSEYFTPNTDFDWTDLKSFRLVVDPRRNLIRFYSSDDFSTSTMEIPFDRSTLPDAADYSWDTLTPFILVGHTSSLDTSGTLQIKEFKFCHLYQGWDSEDGVSPNLAPTDPIFTRVTSGGSIASMASGELSITAPGGSLDKFHRAADCGIGRGAVIEARVNFTSWRPKSRTGTYLILDDGTHAYALTFLENNAGKFVALSRRTNAGGFQEVGGKDGDAATVSFLMDWTEKHTYRMERIPNEGLKVFLDDETTPRITYPESKTAFLPDAQFSGTPTLAFGQFSTEGATSHWSFVRGFFSRGFEMSFKKNKPDNVLRDELINTQAIIVAHVVDAD